MTIIKLNHRLDSQLCVVHPHPTHDTTTTIVKIQQICLLLRFNGFFFFFLTPERASCSTSIPVVSRSCFATCVTKNRRSSPYLSSSHLSVPPTHGWTSTASVCCRFIGLICPRYNFMTRVCLASKPFLTPNSKPGSVFAYRAARNVMWANVLTRLKVAIS